MLFIFRHVIKLNQIKSMTPNQLQDPPRCQLLMDGGLQSCLPNPVIGYMAAPQPLRYPLVEN